jgi:hypothetical protein
LTFFDIEDVDGMVGAGCLGGSEAVTLTRAPFVVIEACFLGTFFSGVCVVLHHVVADLPQRLLQPLSDAAAAAAAAATLHDVLITAGHRHATTGMYVSSKLKRWRFSLYTFFSFSHLPLSAKRTVCSSSSNTISNISTVTPASPLDIFLMCCPAPRLPTRPCQLIHLKLDTQSCR